MEAEPLERPDSAFTPRHEINKFYQGIVIAPESPVGRRARSRCNIDLSQRGRKPDSDEDQGGNGEHDESPTKLRNERRSKGKQPEGRSDKGKQVAGSSRGSTRNYAYCTQRCLKGLTDRNVMDPGCPNYEFHPKGKENDLHAITRPILARLLRMQLAEDRDNYCLDLEYQGSTGRLFKLTLASHGYTFVGKGTTGDFIADSKREARVYQHLKARQGTSIPVYLGNISLVRPWIGENLFFVHMLLMSFAGQCVLDTPNKVKSLIICDEAERFDKECVRIGVLHRDTFARNIMWNEETQNVMFVDFDRTVVFNLNRPPKDVVASEAYTTVFGPWKPQKREAHAHLHGRKPLLKSHQSSTRLTDLRPSSSKPDFAIWSEEVEEITKGPVPSILQLTLKDRETLAELNQDRGDNEDNKPNPSTKNNETAKGKAKLEVGEEENASDGVGSSVEMAF